MDPALQAAHSLAVEPDTCLAPREAYDIEPSDSYPVVGSSPRVLEPAEPGWAPVMEFTAADVFQHSPFGDMLNSLKSLSLSGDSWPNYVRLEGDTEDEENRGPPTTHLIAIVDNLTDMLDFDSEDIDGMDDDAGEEHEPPPTGRWTATSSHDIYMVDTPKENNDEERKDAMEDNPLEKQSNHRRHRRRSKPRHSKSSDTGTRDNNAPDSAEDESRGPVKQISLGVESVFGSNADECVAFMAGSIH